MDQFCKYCGHPVRAGAAFCGSCGSRLNTGQSAPAVQQTNANPPIPRQITTEQTPMPRCAYCGAELKPGAHFCPICGRATAMQVSAPVPPQVPQTVPPMQNPQPTYRKVDSPIGILFKGIGRFLAGIFKSFARPKALLSMFLSAAVWFVLILLPRLGIKNPVVDIFSFLTYAEGGLQGTVLQRIGGFFGKGTIAATVCSLVMGGGPKIVRSVRCMAKSLRFRHHYGAMIFAVGLSPMIYRFIQGGIGLDASITALMGILLSVMASGAKSGWIFSVARAWTARRIGGVRRPRESKASAMLMGLSVGWGLAVPMFSVDLGYIPYYICAGLVVLGILLNLIIRPRKAVTAA